MLCSALLSVYSAEIFCKNKKRAKEKEKEGREGGRKGEKRTRAVGLVIFSES